jgi:hypothetical protein
VGRGVDRPQRFCERSTSRSRSSISHCWSSGCTSSQNGTADSSSNLGCDARARAVGPQPERPRGGLCPPGTNGRFAANWVRASITAAGKVSLPPWPASSMTWSRLVVQRPTHCPRASRPIAARRYREYQPAANQNGVLLAKTPERPQREARGAALVASANQLGQPCRPSDQANTGGKDRGRQPSSGVRRSGEGLCGGDRPSGAGARARPGRTADQPRPTHRHLAASPMLLTHQDARRRGGPVGDAGAGQDRLGGLRFGPRTAHHVLASSRLRTTRRRSLRIIAVGTKSRPTTRRRATACGRAPRSAALLSTVAVSWFTGSTWSLNQLKVGGESPPRQRAYPLVERQKAGTPSNGTGLRPASGRQDLNLRPLDPQSSALPSCATSRAAPCGARSAYRTADRAPHRPVRAAPHLRASALPATITAWHRREGRTQCRGGDRPRPPPSVARRGATFVGTPG